MNYTQRTTTTIISLVALSIVILLVGFRLSKQETEFYPGKSSNLHWFHSILPGKPESQNYVTVVSSGEESESAHFVFHISPTLELPYTSFTVYFADPQSTDDLKDLSHYSSVSFNIQCSPKNILVFSLYSYAEGVTSIQKPETYRVSSDFFTCNNQWQEVSFRLRSLDSAIWWVERYGIEYSNLDADLQNVHGFSFSNSLQSPRGIDSDFHISDLKLIKENYSYLYVSALIVFFMWLVAAYVLTRQYINEAIKTAKTKINDNRPLIAYQQLSIKQRDESLKTKLLQHIAVEYCNPDLTIDGVSELLGTNRIKINEILKSELGLTFTAYINRLRLTEAARLLSLQQKISVKQIAHEVGFSNVTYFNTLFKKEYGCTPKAFSNNSGESD